jgi:hypothetical protein
MTTIHRVLLRVLVPIAALCGAAGAGAADTNPLATTLRGVVEDNVKAYNARDVAGVVRGIHTRSPEYHATKAAVEAQFAQVPATARLIDFDYIGHDDEFAVARMKIAVGGPPTSSFKDDVVDSIMLFHQENGTWKLWQDDVLGVEFVKFVER